VGECKPLAPGGHRGGGRRGGAGQGAARRPTGAGRHLAGHHGRAVLVVPIKPTFKALGIDFFKLKYDGPLSNFAFKFNVRRYTTALSKLAAHEPLRALMRRAGVFEPLAEKLNTPEAEGLDPLARYSSLCLVAGAYTRSRFRST